MKEEKIITGEEITKIVTTICEIQGERPSGFIAGFLLGCGFSSMVYISYLLYDHNKKRY